MPGAYGQVHTASFDILQQLLRQANLHQQQGQFQAERDILQQALTVAQKLQQSGVEAGILLAMGQNYRITGQLDRAIESYRLGLALLQRLKNTIATASALNNLGLIYAEVGQLQNAVESYKKALSLFTADGDRQGQASTLGNLGQIYDQIGEPQAALKASNQALAIFQELKSRPGEGVALKNLGAIYGKLGQTQKALSLFNQALAIAKQLGDEVAQAKLFSNIGTVYGDSGQAQQALTYFDQALPILQKNRDLAAVATTLNNMGAIQARLENPQAALELYQKALSVLRQIQDRFGEATTLNNIGAAHGELRQPQNALDFYRQALKLRQTIGDRVGEALTLSNIGETYRDLKQPVFAITHLQQSAELTLAVRAGLQQENRTRFLQKQQETRTLLVNLLIETGQVERAFEWVNLITTADLADYSRLIRAKVSNPLAQRAIEQWNQEYQELEQLYQQLQTQFTATLSAEINRKQIAISQQSEAITRQFPEVAELFEATPIDIARLRRTIPAGTVILQPVLLSGVKSVPPTLATFVLTRDQLKVTKTDINPQAFDALLRDYRRRLQDPRTEAHKELGSRLYDLLIRPVEGQIKAVSPKQLSIIATEKLRYIPFEALWDQQTRQYLIEKYPINNLTRLSLRVLPQLTQRGSPATLALGNPFPQDGRALPGASEEVEQISAIFSGSKVFLGKQATISTLRTEGLRFSLVHLATHGCFKPEGCPSIRMEPNTLMFADRNLSITDVPTFDFRHVGLVVLSACQTAIQASSNGEELAGMAYLFEQAGARTVLASLWNVSDEQTQRLMSQFYKNLYQGMIKGEALRQAKLKTRQLHPYYWSAFILLGDPGQL
jgi:CHAT domain-containing protein/Tfp pilus assembly protein PilF